MLFYEVLKRLVAAGLTKEYILTVNKSGEDCTLHLDGGSGEKRNNLWALIENTGYQVLGSYWATDYIKVYFTTWPNRLITS